MLPRTLAVLAILLWAAAPQAEPNMFSCTDPSRLAFDTATYQGPSGGPITRTVESVRAGGQKFVRIGWRTAGLGGTEVVTDLDPSTLAPVRSQLRTGLDRNAPVLISDLAINGGELRGSTDPDAPRLAIPIGEEPIIFSQGYLLSILTAAVDWDRCPTVRVRRLEGQALGTTTLNRKGPATISHQGVSVDVSEIDIRYPTRTMKVWVTTAAPRIAIRFTGPSDQVFALVSRRMP